MYSDVVWCECECGCACGCGCECACACECECECNVCMSVNQSVCLLVRYLVA